MHDSDLGCDRHQPALVPEPGSSTSCVAHAEVWASWGLGLADLAAVSLPFIEPMQRRRLSELAKVALSTLHVCCDGRPACPIVFASQHGELERTTQLLNQLAQGEELSPMGFSLAVLNSSLGVYSIATGNVEQMSAVSAGASTFRYGLMEASLLSQALAAPVVFLYADAPVPAIYQSVLASDSGGDSAGNTPLRALALRLLPEAQSAARSVAWEWVTGTAGPDSETVDHLQAFVRCLQGVPQAWGGGDGQTLRWRLL